MKRCKSSADRITDLPAHVLNHILVFLPIKDAGKTSVLSRKWRRRWRSIPQLVFDKEFANILDEPTSDRKVMNKQVMLNILQCLLLHDGHIAKFEISILGLDPCQESGLIILHLFNKGVQDFTLEFDESEAEEERYQMHSSLFSALHLKSLQLQSVKFAPPTWFVGFSKLTHLELAEVILPDDFFENFLPKCPMLERLKLAFCNGLAGDLGIVAPFLKSFSYMGFLDIYFKSTPLLSDLSLHYGRIPDMASASSLASLSRLQRFHVNCQSLQKLAGIGTNAPTRFRTLLHRLNFLCIDDVIFDGSKRERAFVCMIMSSPNLRSLTVGVGDWQSQFGVEPINNKVSSLWRLLEAEVCPGPSDCLQHLREFRIEHSHGTHAELDLMRFVLATAPLLRSIYVRPRCGLRTEKNTKFMKEVLRCKRVSKEAEITYDWDYAMD
ncbi:unnamed protein product [Linum trigynum]|uniref:F-box domain-containing protein n=1 Tax=Linum trigynum TaxID=586398 RepID=A0AAV2F330_9ROSI